MNSTILKLSKKQKLTNKLWDLEEKLYQEQIRIHTMLENRGFGYGMRCTKIGFSETKENNLKARILKIKLELENLN